MTFIKIALTLLYFLKYFVGYLLVFFLYKINFELSIFTEYTLDMARFISIIVTSGSIIKLFFCLFYKIESIDVQIIKKIWNK